MNFTKVECISSKCDGKHIIMNGRGGNFGSRVTTANFKCPECGTRMSIFMWPDGCVLEYRAITEEEIKSEREKKRREAESVEKMKEIVEAVLNLPNGGSHPQKLYDELNELSIKAKEALTAAKLTDK